MMVFRHICNPLSSSPSNLLLFLLLADISPQAKIPAVVAETAMQQLEQQLQQQAAAQKQQSDSMSVPSIGGIVGGPREVTSHSAALTAPLEDLEPHGTSSDPPTAADGPFSLDNSVAGGDSPASVAGILLPGSRPSEASVDSLHIMLSYEWNSQKNVLLVKSELEKAGYKVRSGMAARAGDGAVEQLELWPEGRG